MPVDDPRHRQRANREARICETRDRPRRNPPIFDGGFTRLSNGWTTAGMPRSVKSAAASLQNVERFGDAVTADATKQRAPKAKPKG